MLFCFIIIMLDGYDVVVMGFVVLVFIEDWGISWVEMGLIFGVVMFGVVIGVLVVGLFFDCYG